MTAAALVGRWKSVEHKNESEYADAIGISAELKQRLIKSHDAEVIQEIKIEGGVLTKAFIVDGKPSHQEQYTLGVEEKHTGLDKREKMVCLKEEGGKLVMRETGAYDSVTTYEVSGDTFTSTAVSGGVTSMRKWQRV